MYEVKDIDLSVVVSVDNPVQLVQPQRRISEIYLMDLTSGSSFQLRVGERNPFQPVSRPFSFEPQGDDESNSGLYYYNPVAQAGVHAYVVVVYGKDQLSPVFT